MYTFSNKLRNLAFAFMIVGLAGLIYGFLSAPKTIEEAKSYGCRFSPQMMDTVKHMEKNATATPAEEAQHGDEHGVSSPVHETEAHGEEHDASHDEHVFHQLSNKPWAPYM